MSGLKFTALSGTIDVTENLYIYETEGEMLIVDCGVGFPDIEMRGVDLVIPDFSYVVKNKNKLKGILVSQGHEDHQGALAFLLSKVETTVYAPKLTAAFIKDNLEERGIKTELKVYDPDKDVLTIGSFKVTAFRVPHSIPDTLGFSIDTPEGQVIHVAEHKFDENPVIGGPFDREKVKRLTAKGVLFLASDCLGSNKPGRTPGEKEIEPKIEKIVRNAKGAVFFSAISSNIGRIQQAINVAARVNRKVLFVGRSISKKSEIANRLGYLDYKGSVVLRPKELSNLPRNRIMYIVAGSFGQVGSSLQRIATNSYRTIRAEQGDTTILASDPGPPYSKENIDSVVDNLIDLGVEVHYYDLHEGLHVSGHGNREDIVGLFEIVRPKYFTPIGGTIRFMNSYKKLAEDFGAKASTIFKLKPGEGIEFENGQAKRTQKISVRQVLVDGLGIGDVGKTVLGERKTLAQYGIAVVLIQIDKTKRHLVSDPEVVSRGFVFEEKKKNFLAHAGRILRTKIEAKKKIDKNICREVAIDFLEKFFFKETGRRPTILPIVVEA